MLGTSCAYHLGLSHVRAYSGGTEATSVFEEVLHSLNKSGFQIDSIATKPQAVHAVKYSENQHPILSFSKIHHDSFNPESDFIAIMVCSDAEQKCPLFMALRLALRFL